MSHQISLLNLIAQVGKTYHVHLKSSTQPTFIPPMLATLTDQYFDSSDWIFEEKFDGERCQAHKKKGKVTLLSRNRHTLNTQYPEIVAALEADPQDNFIVDGEIIAYTRTTRSSFQLLQSRINIQNIQEIQKRAKRIKVAYCIFDILHANGYPLTKVPLLGRKTILQALLNYNKLLRYTTHRSPAGLKYYAQACKTGGEGIIAKQADSLYVSTRSRAWRKFKCSQGQELVIGGYTKPRGSRTDFGALLVGYYAHGKLIYAGKVGTGYTHDTLTLLGKKLRALTTTRCPFDTYTDTLPGVTWVKPQLVADFKFAQWTKNGKLRVGRYQGLRTDKSARDVVKEVA